MAASRNRSQTATTQIIVPTIVMRSSIVKNTGQKPPAVRAVPLQKGDTLRSPPFEGGEPAKPPGGCITRALQLSRETIRTEESLIQRFSWVIVQIFRTEEDAGQGFSSVLNVSRVLRLSDRLRRRMPARSCGPGIRRFVCPSDSQRL